MHNPHVRDMSQTLLVTTGLVLKLNCVEICYICKMTDHVADTVGVNGGFKSNHMYINTSLMNLVILVSALRSPVRSIL